MCDTDDIERIRAEKRDRLERDLQDGAATAPDEPIHVDGPAHLADLTAEYGVRGVPTLLLFADGDAVERVVGVQSEDQLSALIEQYA